MSGPVASDSARELAAEVARAGARPEAVRLLLLDVDGTLAPIAPTPEKARIPPDTLAALTRLVDRGWSIVLVSGRPLDQVRNMAPVKGARVFGSHGLEEWPDGQGAIPPGIAARLDALAKDGQTLASRFPGARIEVKPAGMAFHDRLVAEVRLAAWRSSLDDWLDGHDLTGLETLKGRRVLEVRPQGVNKGTVVHRLARERTLEDEDASFVAVGDDRTDEDMFRAIRGIGLSVRVGSADVDTSALRRLASPDSVARFLLLLAGA